MPKKSAAATPECPLNDREVQVVVAALRALKAKPILDTDAMAQELANTNPRSGRERLCKIMKKIGNDPVNLPTSEIGATTAKLAARKKRAEEYTTEEAAQDEQMPDALPPRRRSRSLKTILSSDDGEEGGVPVDGLNTHPIPTASKPSEPKWAIEGGSTLKDLNISPVPSASERNKSKSADDDDDDDEGGVSLAQLSLDGFSHKRAASAEPEHSPRPSKRSDMAPHT
ncbi:hypothetical protein IWX49DRAFT_619543 [Phyllosticta citricarpa]